ncbi:DUF5011 domain-containing protein [Peloplasma aerotolerans]|uniref:DUF5011 domain-containing protein n=1 Tax=Peloplasma aerotolerans TaxID=3044389 RepID=A0AAW6U775_9MOLU|nr:DUF5011 domain-containing protein [Mariniplasma sp. M4Ah]MDI6452770.1 DUF5011 domain-containing protein [Mariniplasma sp. M4Ah]
MKQKFKLLLIIFALLLVVVACKPEDPTPSDPTPTDNVPVISGAVDKTIERGSTFVPLQGITASDVEDGDLTGDIVYSGNVNPNVVGVYQATYTVTDSDGNTTSVTITVTVVLVDTEEPLISGAGDITIFVGDMSFNVMNGVTAEDTVDGTLTDEVEYTGVVDVWTPGEYNITYTVSDAAGNQASRVRKVTVSLGYFAFSDDNALMNGEFTVDDSEWDIVGATSSVTDGILSLDITSAATLSQSDLSGGVINLDVANFTLVKLVLTAKANANRDIHASIEQASTTADPISLTTTMAEYVQYFRMTEPLDLATFELDLGSATGVVDIQSIELFFGIPSDDEAPVLNVPQTDVFAPIDNMSALRSLVLRGVTAIDNIDGNITSKLTLDLDGIDITVPGTVEIPIVARDNAGNETVVERTVHLNIPFDTNVIKDPTFDDELDSTQWGLSGGGEQVTMYTSNGSLIVDVVSPGGWDSATSPYLRNVTTNQLLPENYYMFQFDVKAEKARQMRIRSGLELWSDPWIEDFQDGAVKNLQYQITTEWTTIYYVFYIDQALSAAGSNVVKFEIKLGTITWGSEESNNKISIDNAQFYLLTMEDDDPVISPVADKQLTFAVGDTAPDWTEYVTIFDTEDGSIPVTAAMVDDSDVDMDAVGTYDVVFTVTDSGGNTVSYTIQINVLAEADVTPPVLTINDALETTFDQFADITVDLKAYITAVDDIDGEIIITSAMIENDGFNINIAGTYQVVYTVQDSSGNIATETIEFTVVDKEGPVISGAADKTITIGEMFNPLDGVTVTDNVDGAIVLELSNVAGYELFVDESFVANAVGEFEVTYLVADALGNETELVITITVLQIEFDETLETDLLALQIPVQNDGGTIESVGVYNPDGSLTVTYNGVKGWYGSYSKITYSGVTLLEDRMYKLVIEAEAESARDVLVRFVGENGTAVQAFTGRLVVPIGETSAIYELIFSLDQTGPYNVQLQFGWEGNLNNASDANVMTFTQFKLVPEKVIEYDMDNAADLLALENAVGNDGGNIESVGEYNVDGSLTVTYNGVQGWYASYSKITYYQSLTEGLHYKLILEGKAETARDMLIRFVDGSGVAVPEFDGRLVVSLGTDFNLLEVTFVAPSTDTYNIQLQFGWEGFLTNASDANVMTFTQFLLVPEKTDVVPIESYYMLDDFEGYADQAALELVYTHRVPNAGANHNDEHVLLSPTSGAYGTQGVAFTYGAHSVTGWDLLRTKSNIDNTGLTNDHLYFAFWFKGDGVVTNIYVWLYWSGSQNSKLVNVSDVPAEGGYVYIALSEWGKTATDITQYAFGYDNPSTTGTVYIDQIMFITGPGAFELLEPISEPEALVFVIDDFEGYADQTAMNAIYTHRVPSAGANHDDEHILLGDFGSEGSKGVKFTAGDHGVTGWDIFRTENGFDNTGLTDDYEYFAFWFKGDGIVTSIYVWLYWSGSQDSKTIDVSGVPVDGGYVYIALSNWSKTATQITNFGVAFNYATVPASPTVVYIDDFMFIENPSVFDVE